MEELTEQWLLDQGFIKGPGLLESYSISIAHPKYTETYKVFSVTIAFGNQYAYIREGDINEERHHDALICIYNADLMGPLTTKYIQEMYKLLTCYTKYLVDN